MDKNTIKQNLPKEGFCTSFGNESDFQDFLEELDMNDKHLEMLVTDMKIKAVDSTSPQEIIDVATETRLALEAGGITYPILATAMPSVKRRAELDTNLMGKLSPDVAAGMYNIGFGAQDKKKCTVFLRGEKPHSVLAIHSGRYVVFSQKKIFKCLVDFLDTNFDSVEFSGASYCHDLTFAHFKVEDEALLKAYKTALANAKIPGADNAKIELTLVMSDTGYSSVGIAMNMRLSAKKAAFPFAKPELIPHRDKSTFADIEASVQRVFSLAQEGIVNLNRLMNIKLSCPASFATTITKKFGLPKPLMDTVIPQLQIYEDSGTEITAHDFFTTIAKITEFSQFKAYSEKKKLEVRNDLSKIPFLTDDEWVKFDHVV